MAEGNHRSLMKRCGGSEGGLSSPMAKCFFVCFFVFTLV